MWLETDVGAPVSPFILWTLYFSQSVSHWRTYRSLLSTNTTAGLIQPESGSPGGYCFIICKVKTTARVSVIYWNKIIYSNSSTQVYMYHDFFCRIVSYYPVRLKYWEHHQMNGTSSFPASSSTHWTQTLPCLLHDSAYLTVPQPLWPESIHAVYTSRFIITYRLNITTTLYHSAIVCIDGIIDRNLLTCDLNLQTEVRDPVPSLLQTQSRSLLSTL